MLNYESYMNQSRAQIIATIGPSSAKENVFGKLCDNNLGVARLNFSWGDFASHLDQILLIRKFEKERNIQIPIIQDLPGPRIQSDVGHSYDHEITSSITKQDEEFMKFGIENDVDYIAVSFVSGPEDILRCKEVIKELNGKQRVIAKIERPVALNNLDAIIEVADAIMVARGDLGNEIPIEKIPFIQADIISRSKKASKTVIVATQMLLSMTDSAVPTRAEVTDVANAILQGADCVMLSEETAKGAYPVEAVEVMGRIVAESEKHLFGKITINPLLKLEK